METYSAHDVSAATGVSVQAVRKWCAKNEVSRVRNQWILNPEEYKKACEHFKPSIQSPSEGATDAKPAKATKLNDETKETKETDQVSQVSSVSRQEIEVVELLKQQVDYLKQQVEVKDSQIADLSRALTDATASNKALSGSTALSIAADKKDVLTAGVEIEEKEDDPKEKQSKLRRIVSILFE